MAKFTDFYLRAATKAALMEAIPFAVENGEWEQQPGLFSLDPIGELVITDAVTGEPDADGEVEIIAPAVIADGYCLNLRCVNGFLPDIPDEVIVHPSKPRRVWA